MTDRAATTTDGLTAGARPTALCPVAGVLAGCVAGIAYIAAQASFAATVQAQDAWAPLQRISAILLGPNDLPPSDEHSITIAGIGLLIHFGLAAVFGRLLDVAVRGRTGVAALLRGALVGLFLYGVNFWVVAPVAFPWFDTNRGLVTVVDHLMFGAVGAFVYVHLRPRHPEWLT